MPKREAEFHLPDNPWHERSPGNDAQVLSVDEATGAFTRLSRLEPHTDTTSQGMQVHACWEEVYIVRGSILDLRLNQWFTAGMYAVRPPGMEHGPWRAGEDGALMFEIRYGISDDRERLPKTEYRHP
ncbi:MAG: cupin domain-containing protein [Solirubrobacteraceae bacterium]